MASLEIVDDLIAAGFTDKQARATTRAMKRIAQEESAELATKADLQAVKQELKIDMYAMKADLLFKLGGMMVTVAIAAVTIAVMLLR